MFSSRATLLSAVQFRDFGAPSGVRLSSASVRNADSSFALFETLAEIRLQIAFPSTELRTACFQSDVKYFAEIFVSS